MNRPKLDRSKIVAIITGVISILISIAYLVLVQLLDLRGEMIPAPTSLNPEGQVHVQTHVQNGRSANI
jgi:hypothetical protein